MADKPLKPITDKLNQENNILEPEDRTPEVKLDPKLKNQHKSSSEAV
jgi:hypothetical protein